MAPKKKGNKKATDDWEADLGETADPTAAPPATEGVPSPEDEDLGGGGGLLAALKKNKKQKQKKGKAVQDDYLEGEDPPDTNGVDGHGEPDGITQLAQKVPQEANADEMFDDQVKKVKGGKGKQPRGPDTSLSPAQIDPVDQENEGSSLKSKKEKEKEKKEREKQRKKEQVRISASRTPEPGLTLCRLRRKKQPLPPLLQKQSPSRKPQKPN